MKKILFIALLSLALLPARAEHPSLMLTRRGAEAMRADRGKVPAFDASIARTLAGADAALAAPIGTNGLPAAWPTCWRPMPISTRRWASIP